MAINLKTGHRHVSFAKLWGSTRKNLLYDVLEEVNLFDKSPLVPD